MSLTRYGLRFDHCDTWAWGEAPLADAATHAARKKAHDSFDRLWKRGPLSRTAAYQALAAELGIAKEACHMKLMDRETAEAVPLAVKKIREALTPPDCPF